MFAVIQVSVYIVTARSLNKRVYQAGNCNKIIAAVIKSREGRNFWWSVLVQAVTHALVRFTVTLFWASVQISNLQHTFGVHSIATPTAVKQVKLKKLAFVKRSLVEDNG